MATNNIGFLSTSNYLEHFAKRSQPAKFSSTADTSRPPPSKKKRTLFRSNGQNFSVLAQARKVFWCAACNRRVQLRQGDAVGCPGCRTPRLDAEPYHLREDPQRQLMLRGEQTNAGGTNFTVSDLNGFAATTPTQGPRVLAAR